jgi:dTDP-4-dehydrorhamnose 3,5-epimerase
MTARDCIRVEGTIPHDVTVRVLSILADARGSLTEVFRQSWVEAPAAPVQWNVVTSAPGVLRGMHVHLDAFEYYVVLSGRVLVGYRDTRRGSPTEGCAGLVAARAVAGALPAIAGPPGLVHGIYTHEPTVLLTATTTYWNPEREIGCHWRDPALQIPWPFTTAVTSARDEALPPLGEIQHLVPPFGAVGGPGS